MKLHSHSILKQFKLLDTLFIALFGTQLIFAVTALFIVLNNFLTPPYIETSFIIFAVIVLNTSAIFITKSIYKIFQGKMIAAETLAEKMQLFRQVSIVKMGLIEGTNFFNLAAYFLSGEILYILIFGLMLVLLFIHRPTVELFTSDADLSPEDKSIIISKYTN